MNWAAKLLATDRPEEPLSERIDALLAQQRASWPAMAQGEASLASLETKTLHAEDGRVVVQANPGRRRSTHAKVDAASVAERPCFLCPANMPIEERGIACGDLVILPNPYPILPRHLTIPSREHAPQRLAGRVELLLELAQAAGPGLAVFYNGPRCGASAPDHFHFQACDADALPVFGLNLGGVGRKRRAVTSFGRAILLFASADLAEVAADVNATLDVLCRDAASGDEPMVNVVVTMRDERVVAAIFPRAAHRPTCYFAEGSERLAISPAALEMAGVLVVAEPEQFPRVDAAIARRIYEEVSLDSRRFDALIASLAQRQVILDR
jgi:Domain of unknown function (DUF4922)